MEGQDRELLGSTMEGSEALKPFSDAKLLKELQRRLFSAPIVNPAILQTLQLTVAELQKRAEIAKPAQVEPRVEESVPIVETRPESSVESEGAKWAKILREKGAGLVGGKFRRSWGYTDTNGNFQSILSSEDREIEFIVGGRFGDGKIPFNGRSVAARSGQMQTDTSSNFLIIGDAGLDMSEMTSWKGHKAFIYRTSFYASQSGDSRHVPVDLDFKFSLPPEESSQFIDKINESPDFVEDVFQKVYPGFTGEKGPKRFIVDRLTVIDNIVTGEEETYSSIQARKRDRKRKPNYETVVFSTRQQTFNFSKPVGEIAS